MFVNTKYDYKNKGHSPVYLSNISICVHIIGGDTKIRTELTVRSFRTCMLGIKVRICKSVCMLVLPSTVCMLQFE